MASNYRLDYHKAEASEFSALLQKTDITTELMTIF